MILRRPLSIVVPLWGGAKLGTSYFQKIRAWSLKWSRTMKLLTLSK